MSTPITRLAAKPKTMLVQGSGLSKRYGSTTALHSLTLSLHAGPPVALIGPNGAGKTTFLSLLCGYILPTAGTVSVLGHAPGSAALHGKLTALAQDAQLDPRFSIARQLIFFARLQGMSRGSARLDVDRVLDLVQLRSSAKKKPSELSHGMRKRVAIAQSLLGQPQLALLDEPTAGLDPPNVRMIRELISSNAHETTFIISSHNLDELEKVCSSVVYLSEGHLREHMPIDQHASDDGYLTIRMRGVVPEEFIAAVEGLKGVSNVVRKQQEDYAISFDPASQSKLDQSLLQLIAHKGWHYKHLVNGRTLEEKIF